MRFDASGSLKPLDKIIKERVFVMKKSRLRMFSLLLAILMLAGLASTALAFTANTGTTAAVQAELPPGLFFSENLGSISLVKDSYYYDRGLGRNVQSYALSDASKLSLLLDYCMPVYRLQSEIDQLKVANRASSLDKIISNQQQVTIWGCLTKSTQNRISSSQMNAQEALNYIRTSAPEYQSNTTLQRFVNYYLEEFLSGTEVREILKILDPSGTRYYDDYNIAQLITYGESMLAGWRVANLITAMQPFQNKTTTPYALEKNYSSKQLATYYKNLSSAASYYYADYIQDLDGFRFTL